MCFWSCVCLNYLYLLNYILGKLPGRPKYVGDTELSKWCQNSNWNLLRVCSQSAWKEACVLNSKNSGMKDVLFENPFGWFESARTTQKFATSSYKQKQAVTSIGYRSCQLTSWVINMHRSVGVGNSTLKVTTSANVEVSITKGNPTVC
jgi:hypothetical protein